jgi:hypothetical protein
MALMGKLVGDLGAITSIGPMVIGEKLGLYKAMADGAPVTAADLAAKTNTNERYVNRQPPSVRRTDPSIFWAPSKWPLRWCGMSQ